MPEILIDIRNKIPTLLRPVEIVTDNTDYTVRFTWDDEWETAGIKTVFFVSATGENMPVVMEGSTCAVPMITAWRALYIGVQAGELHTTRPCAIRVAPSIARQTGEVVPPEEFDKWAQIVAMLDDAMDAVDADADRAEAAAYDAEQHRDHAANSMARAQQYAEAAEDMRNEAAGIMGMATFEIDVETGELYITYPEPYSGAAFQINNITGELEVITT